jgi:transposase InsO family protein
MGVTPRQPGRAQHYREVLRLAAVRQSMRERGGTYDKAFMESCFGTIRTELELALRKLSTLVRHYSQ